MWGAVLFFALVLLCLVPTTVLYRQRNTPQRGQIIGETSERKR